MTVSLTSNINELVSWFQMEFPGLVRDMKRAQHHYSEDILNPYHLEGDVFTHTMMVCLQAQNFSPENDHVRWSSLLHDIGKPAAREVVEKHVDFSDMSDEEIYEKYKHYVDEFVEQED